MPTELSRLCSWRGAQLKQRDDFTLFISKEQFMFFGAQNRSVRKGLSLSRHYTENSVVIIGWFAVSPPEDCCVRQAESAWEQAVMTVQCCVRQQRKTTKKPVRIVGVLTEM
jgi:hypothetical protein